MSLLLCAKRLVFSGLVFILFEKKIIQGDIACTRIGFGKGVCGTSWEKAETILVPDVEQFEGHIACSNASKSEIVVPIIFDGIVRSVLDIDSDQLDDFTQIDKQYLEVIAKDLAYLFSNV